MDPTLLDRFPLLKLGLVSALILFLELACIRWFAATVVYLTFFTNVVLLACVLGMSVGCLAAEKAPRQVWWVLPIGLVATSLAQGVLWAFRAGRTLAIDVGGQKSPQEIFFGTEGAGGDLASFVVPIEVLASIFFVLIAWMFVGLGQQLGQAFNQIGNRVLAYSANLGGSVLGILAFTCLSAWQATPHLWFAIGLAGWLAFLPRLTWFQVVCQIAILGVVAVSAYGEDTRWTAWSPYYKVEYQPLTRTIETNNIGHQAMVDTRISGQAYSLPHLVNRDAGGTPFEDVLIIGAGSGNDVAAALVHQAQSVDAVEIDPVIWKIGQTEHPNHPYSDPRVKTIFNDGRDVLRNTSRSYDLILYALVDSLVLHSSQSNLRLESFLFTRQAFEEIKARLQPDGVFVMANYYRQGWVVTRLAAMAKQVFGTEPIVLSLPFREKIRAADREGDAFTILLCGSPDSSRLNAIRHAFEQKIAFWSNGQLQANLESNAFGERPPGTAGASSWLKIAPSTIVPDPAETSITPTDDWPFLYLKTPTIPWVNLKGIALIAVLSLIMLVGWKPARTTHWNGQMLFLGAGFMLLETKSVVHLALLFGSTWVVNSIVIGAVLSMALVSNLFVLLAKPSRSWIFYLLLFASLGLNLAIPLGTYLDLAQPWRLAASCSVLFLPILFAGVIFAIAFRASERPDQDLGANIAGVILGGLSEYASLMLGFNNLLVLALVFYGLSAVFASKRPPVGG